MAKVSISVNSDVEDYGAPLRDSLQLTAEAFEGFCSYILGDPDIMEEQYKKIILSHAQFVGIVTRMRNDLDMLHNG